MAAALHQIIEHPADLAGIARNFAGAFLGGIELFELYGHGPPDEGRSFMWTDAHAAWQEHNPPPLATIGDQTVQQWRAAEKQEATAGAGAAI